MAALPDDIILDIFLRVPDVGALFRCATTCKAWHRLITDLSFLRRRWPENDPGSWSLLGFFLTGHDFIKEWEKHTSEIPNPLRTPVFVPTPRSVLGHARRYLGSLIPNAARLLSDAKPLASRRGLLVVLLEEPDISLRVYDRNRGHLAVCNLFAGTCDVLPALDCSVSSTRCCCVILTSDDCSPSERRAPLPEYSTFFKVLMIVDKSKNPWSPSYDLYEFSSADKDWTAHGRCFSHEEHNRPMPIGCGATVCRGVAYWLFQDGLNYYALGVSIEIGRIFFTKIDTDDLPRDSMIPWLSTANDMELSLLLLCERPLWKDFRVDILTQQSGNWSEVGATDWFFTRRVELNQPKQRNISLGCCKYMGEKGGIVLFMDSHENMCIADLETRKIKEVTLPFCGLNCNSTVVPVEIEWPAFFMSRLGERSY